MDVQTIKRPARVGDLVVSPGSPGIIWEVERVYLTVGGGKVRFYGVFRLDKPGIPNALYPKEVAVVAAKDAAALRAAQEEH